MMKRIISVLFAIVLLCASLPTVLAEGGLWTCSTCGRSCEDNFCPNDATPRPVSSSWICPTCGEKCDKSFCPNDATPRTQRKTVSENVKVGDCVTFGSYEQDGNTANGKEDIEWLVLHVYGDTVLLVSKFGLDAVPYNEVYDESVTWRTSTLRSWLNEDFYNTAFNTEEKKRIIKTRVTVDKNPDFRTDQGRETEDFVFLLSILEAEKYFEVNVERMCYPTQFIKSNGLYPNNTCRWWTRSLGDSNGYAAFITQYGGVDTFGRGIHDKCTCVRPTITLRIEN